MKFIHNIKNIDAISEELEFSLLKIDGVHIWPLVRKNVYQNVLKNNDGVNNVNYSKYSINFVFKVLSSTILAFFSLLKFLIKIKPKKFVFLGFSRRCLENGEFVDKFHDPIIESLELDDCLLIEKPFKGTHSNNRATKSDILDYDVIFYAVKFISFLCSPLYFIINRVDIQNVCRKINTNLKGRDIVNCLFLSKKVFEFKLESRVACYFLRKLNTDKLIVTSRWLHFPFIYAANMLDIETIEIQHGAILRNSTFYKNVDDFEFGIDTMFTFSEFWNDYPWGAKKTLSIGSHQYQFEKSKDSYESKVVSNILLVSQPELSTRFSQDIVNLSLANIDKNFVVKLHPQDHVGFSERYSKCIDLVNVRFVKDFTSSEDLGSFDLVLGYKSTMLYEASSRGIPVGLLVSEPNERMDYLSVFGSEILNEFAFVETNCDIDTLNIKISNLKFFESFSGSVIRKYMYEACI